MDYFKFTNYLKPGKGRLLISEPFLPDPNFERTVVLLCEHNEDGSFGFVLNKVSAVSLEDIVDGVSGFDRDVYIGGPVQQDSLHFLHRSKELQGGTEIVEGLYWGGDFEQLMSLIEMRRIQPSDFKFFVGYSGWESGQLDQELKTDSWIVTREVTPDLVFDEEEEIMWKSLLNRLGGRFSVYSNYPIDPRLN